MKRLLYILSLLPIGLSAQNMYNVSSMFENELLGTARYVGMGGSMSALGADLTTMGTNPAGMAMYRSSDFAITAGLNVKTNEAIYEGTAVNSNNVNAYLGNAAFVFSLERDGKYLKYLNIGLGYRKKNNLTSDFEMCGYADGFSQQFVMYQLYNTYNTPFDYNNMSSSMYTNLNYSWLTLLAADAYLCDNTGDNFLAYDDSTLVWTPDDLDFYEEVRGGVSVVDFNLSANFNDRVYLGATVGVANVDYNRYTAYSESDSYGAIYTLENNAFIKGYGFDLKLGAIFRPFKYSPFKIGLAVHTPTFYNLNEYYSAAITDPDGKYFTTTDADFYGGDFEVRSKLATPWRFNAAMSYTFGTYLALNAEYEYADYRTAAFTGRSKVGKAQNEEISYNMKAQHTARIGAELNVDGFAVRLGYNYITAPFASDAYKELANASVIETSTDYMNRFDKNIVTAGLGFRGEHFYFDLAYMMEQQESEFYPFYDYDYPNPGALVSKIDHSVVATLGVRF